MQQRSPAGIELCSYIARILKTKPADTQKTILSPDRMELFWTILQIPELHLITMFLNLRGNVRYDIYSYRLQPYCSLLKGW